MSFDERAHSAGSQARRAAASYPAPTAAAVMDRGRRRRVTRVTGAALAVVLAVGGVGVAVARLPVKSPDVAFPPGPDAREPAVACLEHEMALPPKTPSGWQRLARPPLPKADGHAAAATDTHVVVVTFGEEAGTAMLDVEAKTWSCAPPAPLTEAAMTQGGPVSLASAGSKVYAWDGERVAVLDVPSGAWKRLPDPPAPENSYEDLEVVAAGSELVVWWLPTFGSRMHGATWDFSSESWHAMPRAPITVFESATTVWTGTQLFLFGHNYRGTASPFDDVVVAASFAPESGRWTRLPSPPLTPLSFDVEWIDGRVVAVDYKLAAAAYDAERDVWQGLSSPPLDFGECGAGLTSAGDELFLKYCGRVAAWDGRSQEWTPLPSPPEPAAGGVEAVGRILVTTAPTTINYAGGTALADVDDLQGQIGEQGKSESADLDPERPAFDTWEQAAIAEAQRVNSELRGWRADRVTFAPQLERVRVRASGGYCHIFGGSFASGDGWQANDLGPC